ncbi:hypothetical protein TCDM_11568 [Trypanosoma cruzi Dm28c]|uniref:Uncharacterized protein n=1 Tax=Trypanosoma cruzi Dm28c TaxID=1416333 RepID=V5B4H7_TRYCR|nr:hypothetical protein TCDM_11568 [Trypanosoma cruzi Dm28c]
MSLVQSIQTNRVYVYTDRDMPVDIGLSLLHTLLSVGTAAAVASRRSSGRRKSAAALLLPWIGGGASISASQPPRTPAASSSLGGGSTAPCASSAASGLLGPVAAAPPPALSLTASSPTDCSTTGITQSAATSSMSGRSLSFSASCGASAMSGRSLSFSASCGASAMSLGKSTPLPSWHLRRHPSPLATDASGEQPCPHPSVVCHGRSQCSPQRGRMPVAKLVQYMPVKPSCSTRPLLAVPPSHGNETAACGGYRTHLRAVTANNGPLIVARSNLRNRRPVRTWIQRTLTFSVTHRCTRMPRHFNAACMAAPRCMYPPGPSHPSCWWKACPDNTKWAHPQESQTNILPSK